MRLSLCIAACVLLAPGLVHAHGDHDAEPKQHRARLGGLGYMQLGTHIGPVGDVEGALTPASALGDRATSPGFGYTIGGGGRLLLMRRLVIGGRGFGVLSGRVGGDRGSASVTGGGGGLELGVAAVNRDSWLLIPYVGGGGGGLTLEVSNESGAPLTIADDESIPSGGSRTYDAGFAYMEFGLATHRLLFFGEGGFALGFDVGATISVAPSAWTTSGRDIGGIDRARLSGGFLRLTLGGGGFWFD